ncbi:MAG TPA: hypothetical protein DGT23_30435 [Micromonosporaceae bacterium]|nr:hypothetical protein [Micromonosporaceae bacterium]
MNVLGDNDLLVAARGALLDALEALKEHRNAVVVIGAQAIHLHTGGAQVALAEATKDSDLALDTRALAGEPLLEETMERAGFRLDPAALQPGAWLSPAGIPVDLMVPEALAGSGGRRGARIPPHSKNAARRAFGLEAAVVDFSPIAVKSLGTKDSRSFRANIASPAALLVAKLHKLGERQGDLRRLMDKDAHDIYRLLVAVPTNGIASSLLRLCGDPLAGKATTSAVTLLGELFAKGSGAPASKMAGRAEEGVGDPALVSAAVAALADDLMKAMNR